MAAVASRTLLAAPVAAQVETPPTADPDRMVCKTVRLTGSLLRKAKDCRRAREWDNQRRKTRASAEPPRGAAKSG